MKEIDPLVMTGKESFTATFLVGALPTIFLRNATNETALQRLYDMYRRLPAKADKLADRNLRTQVREIKPYDFCNVSLKMISAYSGQAITHRTETREFERFDRLAFDWTRRRSLSADLVLYLENNSFKLDHTIIQLHEQIPK